MTAIDDRPVEAPDISRAPRRKWTPEQLAKLTPEQRESLRQLVTPRIVDPYFKHVPHPKQQLFIGLNVREAMYGGAAGGGKSDALLMGALQYVDVPGYSALLLRRTWPDLSLPGAIMDRTNDWLAATDAKPKEGGRRWVFPSGARITFGYLQHDKDVQNYQSAEFQYIGFDELTQFSQRIYQYMFSRIRRPSISCLSCGRSLRKGTYGLQHSAPRKGETVTPCVKLFPDPNTMAQYSPAKDGRTLFDVPLRMRSATNPGGPGHEWVKNYFIDPKTKRKGAVFIPALMTDNPSLDQETYLESLQHLAPVDRERLLAGDWDVAEEGQMFQRWWFKVTEHRPHSVVGRIRYWDLAASDGRGDYTVGALVSLSKDGQWYVEDIVRGQWSPMNVEKVIAQTAQIDGTAVQIRMEQEPGSSGVNVISHYARNVLVGYQFKGVRPTGDKATRAAPLASAAEAGNCFILADQWNVKMLDEFALFPGGANDDQVDAVSGAFGELAFGRRARIIV